MTNRLLPLTFLGISFALVSNLSGMSQEDARRVAGTFETIYHDVDFSIAELPKDNAILVADADGLTPLARALSLENLRPPLSKFMPNPPVGWEKRPMRPDDYVLTTGVPPIDWSVVNPEIDAIATEMMDHVEATRKRERRDRGVERAEFTYRNGSRMILLTAEYLPDDAFDGPQGAVFGLLQTMMRDLCSATYVAEPFGERQGFEFQKSLVAGSDNAYRVEGFGGRQLHIKIIANMEPTALNAFVNRMNLAELSALADLSS